MILNSYNNILVLAPHTDDGELGLGGTISKLIELGKKVRFSERYFEDRSQESDCPIGNIT